ncbi:MAG: hypothetical protein N2255_10065 [Kiritimatiellae bacterium]|nr:hypothetical protein [Kiritimatiellia bacterium]
MEVIYRVFKDFRLSQQQTSDEEIFQKELKSARARRNRYSFVSLRWHEKTQKLYVGTTHALGDLLLEFDPRTGRFRSCGYAQSGLRHEHEHKIHKGLWLDEEENALYFGTTTLSPISAATDSAGGSLVKFDIARRCFSLLARPTPADYYQATCYDQRRHLLYMYTMPGSMFAVYDLQKKKLRRYVPVESIPHIGCIDDEGGVWGTYDLRRQAFFRYLPDKDRFEFPPNCRLLNSRDAANVMYLGAGPVDSFLNGKDGYLYVGSALGELWRLNPVTKELKYLGKPFAGKRLPGLYLASDGYLYLSGGSDGTTMLARYDRQRDNFEMLGPVKAEDGTTCYRCHELVVEHGVAYIGETDNRERSGYLWICRL